MGTTGQELEGILYKLKRRPKKRLPPECYKIVEEEFEAIEAYIEKRKQKPCPYS